jgi:hypothetical protein
MAGLVKFLSPQGAPVWVAPGQVCEVFHDEKVQPGAAAVLVGTDGNQQGVSASLDDVAKAIPGLLSAKANIGRVLIAPANVTRVKPYRASAFTNPLPGAQCIVDYGNNRSRVLFDPPEEMAERIGRALESVGQS